MRTNKPRIILASESQRRALLLKSLGIRFSVLPSQINERNVKATEPKAYAKKLATLKARDVSARVKSGIIIGADTLVVAGKSILNKPKDRRDAHRMLKLLSGKTHRVITGVCVINMLENTQKTFSVSTKVRFKRLSERAIKRYMDTGEPMGKAGAYAIQGKGAVLVEKVSGDYDSIVGLPLVKLTKILKEMGVLDRAASINRPAPLS